MSLTRILHGDCMEILATLPAASVHCVVTSPPYFSLRDYGVPPRIWGGDVTCIHAWESAGKAEGYTSKRKWQHSENGRGDGQPAEKTLRDPVTRETVPEAWDQIEQGKVCHCGAWLGALGLQPTPDLFIEHTVMVFREVRRVLRNDGTLWLNIGDSYAAGGKGGGGSFMAERKDAAWQKKSGLNGWRSAPPGLKSKDLIGIPWMLAFALRADGWYLRSDIIWHKPNPMPESINDRPTKSHEYLFLLSKSRRYYYDAKAIRERAVKTGTVAHIAGGSGERAGTRGGLRRDEWLSRQPEETPAEHPLYRKPYTGEAVKDYAAAGVQNPSDVKRRIVDKILAGELDGRNRRSVWTIPTQPTPEAHFATFPEDLVEPCVRAGCPPDGTVLDPFTGSGTVAVVCQKLQRNFVGIELNPEYIQIAEARIRAVAPLFAETPG